MTDDEEFQEEPQLLPPGVGERLREARRAMGMDLSQISAETRIPERHLIAIESGNFAALPARTYAVGFSRSYARVVGLDEKAIAAQVREELSARGGEVDRRQRQIEPGDPARVPSRGLAWLAALAVVLLIAGGFSFYRSYFAPGSGPGSLIEEERLATAKGASAAQPAASAKQHAKVEASGQVVFTALEQGVWVKFYDSAGQRLFEKQMDKDERFAIPADADGPQIWTGRPDAFAITIGGKSVPKLDEEERTIKDVAIDAETLLARAKADEATAPIDENAVDNTAT